MQWSPRQARFTLLLFILIVTAGQVKACLTRPVYPESRLFQEDWPPHGHLVDATVLEGGALVVYTGGTTVAEAVADLGLDPDQRGSGFCLPRSGVLHRSPAGWSIRPMTQRERWVWRIPMDLYHCKPGDLERIRGIGPSLAGKICAYVKGRGYLDSLSDLEDVPGVGPGKLEELRKELTLN